MSSAAWGGTDPDYPTATHEAQDAAEDATAHLRSIHGLLSGLVLSAGLWLVGWLLVLLVAFCVGYAIGAGWS